MYHNRLTRKSQEALRQAYTIAAQRSHQGVDVEHIFSASIDAPEGIVPVILGQADVPLARLQEEVELSSIPQVSGGGSDQVYVTQRLSRLLTHAGDEAQGLKDEYVSVDEHLLLALLEDDGETGRLLRV